MPKSTKRFVISDESLNRYGFRVLTSGIDLTQFEKNPICLYVHQRSDSKSETVKLPIGHWQDIRREGGQITAIPFLSDNDELAMKIFHKIEENTLRMASAGLQPVEASMDAQYMLPSQELPTVTKSIMYEASIADMGVNNNALVVYNDGSPVNLSDNDYGDFLIKLSADIPNILTKNSNTMNPELLALAITLGLTEKASQAELIQKVSKQNAEFVKLSAENTQLSTEVGTLKTTIEAMTLASTTKDIELMLSAAVDQGKITADEKADYAELAVSNPDKVKALLDKKPVHVTAQMKLAQEAGKSDNSLLTLSFEELHKQGKLEQVKTGHPEHYKNIFKAKFGHDPK